MKGNLNNLRPPFTPEEAREIGKRGAQRSAEVRRAKKQTRELAMNLLSKTLKDEGLIEKLNQLGIRKKNFTIHEAAIAGQILGCIAGDARCFKVLIDVIEPRDSVDTGNMEDLSPLADLLNAEDEDNDGGGENCG